MKSIIIIGAGMGGLASGIFGQMAGFDTTIYEAGEKPGGQCASWTRKGYVFDACVHDFGVGAPGGKFNEFWRELGVIPFENLPLREAISAVFPDGTSFRDYYDIQKLEAHMKGISPEDSAVIDSYINGIKRFIGNDFTRLFIGQLRERLFLLPSFVSLSKYFRRSLDDFGKRFEHPALRRVFPLLHHSVPGVPLFLHLAKHADAIGGGLGWPKGGSLTISRKMSARYKSLGGTIFCRQKAVKILVENNRARGVKLEDGSEIKSDFVISNADGRKTILELLSGRYVNRRILNYCKTDDDEPCPFSIIVFLGVKRDLSSYPSNTLVFLEEPAEIAGIICDHLDLQMYGFDESMAPAGKGVIKVELFSKPSYFSIFYGDKQAYRNEKRRITDRVISLLDRQYPGLQNDLEVSEVVTLKSWERYMGGTNGYNNFPNKKFNPAEELFGYNRTRTLPGLKNFYFCGQWTTSAGALFMNALSGKKAIEKIIKANK